MIEILKNIFAAFLAEEEQAGIDNIADLLAAIFGKLLAAFDAKDAE